MTSLYAFELGREWRLSLAEIESLFGADSVRKIGETLVLIETEKDVRSLFHRMGGVIRAFRILMPL